MLCGKKCPGSMSKKALESTNYNFWALHNILVELAIGLCASWDPFSTNTSSTCTTESNQEIQCQSQGLAVEMHCVEGDECLEDERNALLAFKSWLDDRMGRLHSWKGLNCCSWEGILCSPSNGQIIRLYLHNPSLKEYYYEDEWALRGSINNALFRLQHLEHLDLSGNDFNSTPIPPEIGAFKYLRYLSLSGANFGGNIPPQLGNLSRLQHLDLSGSDLDGSIPLELGSLSQLQHLDLSANYNLENPSFSWVTNLTALRHLSLDRVNFTMAGKHWGNALPTVSHLEYLSVTRCGISGVIPPSLSSTSLSSLISTCPTMISILKVFRIYHELNGLISPLLILHPHKLEKRFSIALPTLPRSPIWTSCTLYSTISTSAIVSEVMRHSLLALAGSSPQLSKYVTESLQHASSTANSFGGNYLDLSENQFNGFIPTQFGEYNCRGLLYLSLRRNNLNGSIPPLSQCTYLEVLDLSDNHLSGSLPPGLSNCSSLQVLNLSNNELHGEIPEQLGMLQHLQTFQLSYNRLSGPLPTKLENWTHLQFLDMGHNNITGDIPRYDPITDNSPP
eukprot:Gb_30574 [translate_table: standard]